MPFYIGNVMSKTAECRPRSGELDTSFSNTTFDGAINSLVIQPDGKIVVGGGFNNVTSGGVTVGQGGLARLNIDGTRDTTFTTGAGGTVEDLTVQPDGKIIVVGRFASFRGVTRNRIARVNADGTLDTGFNNSSQGTVGVNLNAFSVTLQSDGKILVGGLFTTARGITKNGLLRLNSDGTLDNDFNVGSSIGVSVRFNIADTIYKFIPNSDGSIYIFGEFNTVRGVARNKVAKINSIGELDTSFDPGTGFNDTVHDAFIQGNNIVCLGNFTTYNGVSVRRLARISNTGSRDTTWPTTAGPGTATNLYTLLEQYDKKIFVGGTFSQLTFGGTDYTENSIGRFSSDGALDTEYNSGTTPGVDNSATTTRVLTSALQDDCKIIIGGAFTSARGVTVSNICRLM